MEKVVEYRYPKPDKAGNLKIIQDPTSQILAYSFTRDEIKYVENEKHSNNNCIYFLLNHSEENKEIYIGQTTEGVRRIKAHQRNKEFWTRCLLFTTDNNSFNKNYIDILEHHFINKFKKNTEYTVINDQNRSNDLNTHINVSTVADQFATQIEFLLSAEGIIIDTSTKKTGDFYKAKASYEASIYLDGENFILTKGSIINWPRESSKEWKDSVFFDRFTELIKSYIEDGKVTENGEILRLESDIAFKSPSKPASMIAGNNVNGWLFFENLNKLRNNND